MNTKTVKAPPPLVQIPFPGNVPLYCRVSTANTADGKWALMALSGSQILSTGFGLPAKFRDCDLQVLTWTGDNFAWREVVGIHEVEQTLPASQLHIDISGRTGHNKVVLPLDAWVRTDKEVYGLTVSLNDGVWRRADRLSAGRSLSSVNGPEIGYNLEEPVQWANSRLVMANAQVVKVKQKATSSYAPSVVAINLGEAASNVVLACGAILKTHSRKGELK